MSHDKFFGICENKCLVEINADSVGAAAQDLSNIDNAVFAEKATAAGVGGGGGIVSEVVPIENGGTGATTAEEARTNLSVASADHTHTLEEITGTSVLAIENGGTGATTAEEARTNLNVAAVDHTHTLEEITGSSVLSIEKGGTGATTAEEARTNLGVASSDLSNVDNTVFLEKATSAGVGGSSSSSGGVGKDLTGQTFIIAYDSQTGTETKATAGTNAEIFNDYRDRTYNDVSTASQGNIASGEYSHAEGHSTTASGKYSHAEGHSTIASGDYSHAEGHSTKASGLDSHAEGNSTVASGSRSHAEGQATIASKTSSHAEGGNTKANAHYSHAEGNSTTASGEGSHAEGKSTTASGDYGSHAEGDNTTASGDSSHAEGGTTTASGDSSHAEGRRTIASGDYSHAGGRETNASGHSQTAIGRYNKISTTPSYESDTTGDLFIIGNGTSSTTLSNAFRVTTAGGVYGLKSYSSSGADYAEYFEWLDGNPEDENRRGYFVTLDGDKIRKATAKDEYILGVVSATPAVEGDSHSENWCDMYLRDVFGEKLIETVEVEETTNERGKVVPAHTEKRWILNPEYDSSLVYENRENRKEWSPVGLMGKLVVIDDGTCQVNGYCKPNENGIATASNTGYRVMKRLDKNHVRILLK